MRVALIGPVPSSLGGHAPGGVATHQVDLAAGLAAAGAYAPLLATNIRGESTAWHATNGEAPFPMYRVGRGWTSLDRVMPYALRVGLKIGQGSRREVLKNLVWYHRFLTEVRPDVIHVQHALDRCLYARTVRGLDRINAPLVVTAHSLFGEHSDEIIRTLMSPNLRAADRVIAVSQHVADQATQLGVEPERIHVIHSGVDLQRFCPRDSAAARKRVELADEARVVLFVGNLEPRKQIDVLLRAMVGVREQVPDAVLLVVGSGESAGAQDQTARLLRLARDLDFKKTRTEAVRFVGEVDPQQLVDYYAAADVFALASSSEAQGIVALEAMACGLPVVATAVGGLRGTIEDGETGFLIPPGDAGVMAERLVEVLRDSARRQAMGAAARGAVERQYSWSHAVGATLRVYEEALRCP